MTQKSKYFAEKWDKSHLEISKQVFDDYGNERIPENAVLSFINRSQAVIRIKKSAIASAFELKTGQSNALPEQAESIPIDYDQRRLTVRKMAEDLLKRKRITQETYDRLVGENKEE